MYKVYCVRKLSDDGGITKKHLFRSTCKSSDSVDMDIISVLHKLSLSFLPELLQLVCYCFAGMFLISGLREFDLTNFSWWFVVVT